MEYHIGMQRRSFLQAILLSAAAPAFAEKHRPHVAVVGGGFGGMSVLRAMGNRVRMTLIEPNPVYFGCPASNMVVAGFYPLARIRHPRENANWTTVRDSAVRVGTGKVFLKSGQALTADRVVVSPGVGLDFGAMPGYSESNSQSVPHAWRGEGDGRQMAILRKQIEAIPSGGVFIVVPPEEPHSCPPAPYERASLAAARFAKTNPRAKVLVIDPKEKFAKQSLFAPAWRALYGEMIEWRGGEAGGIVEALNLRGGKKIVETEFGEERADVLNYIPPQSAGRLARDSGLTDDSGWCPVHPATFESPRAEGVYVIGDAAATRMPKSASAAKRQGEAAAAAILREFGFAENNDDEIFASVCYSLAGLEYGLSSEARYRPSGANGLEMEKLGEILTPPDADDSRRRADAQKAEEWHSEITGKLFG